LKGKRKRTICEETKTILPSYKKIWNKEEKEKPIKGVEGDERKQRKGVNATHTTHSPGFLVDVDVVIS